MRVTVPAGAKTAQFNVTTAIGRSTTTITATYNGSTAKAKVFIGTSSGSGLILAAFFPYSKEGAYKIEGGNLNTLLHHQPRGQHAVKPA